MKEYEFIVHAIEEDFCDQLTALICYESYRVEPLEDGYRRLFDKYGDLYNLFRGDEADSIDLDALLIEYRDIWNNNCNERLKDLLKDLKKAQDEKVVEGLKEHFVEKLNLEDVQTPEKKAFVHPYLITMIRKYHSKKDTMFMLVPH